MGVELDAPNLADGDAFTTVPAGIGDYPTASSSDDILGKLFVEEYNSEYYFYWECDSDGEAEIWPNIGSASATTKIDGTTALTASDFHEVNFAYQLARFCHYNSTNNKFCLGGLGVCPPASLAPADISSWLGTAPTYTRDSQGHYTIEGPTSNGTGLLGNKFMAGSYSWRSGAAYGGFPLTDTDWLDSGSEVTDTNGFVVDLGKYISIVSSFGKFFNSWDTTGRGYVTTEAPTYLGLASSLDEKEAPTNKKLPAARSVFDVREEYVDSLVRFGYVHARSKNGLQIIADAPTAAMPTSDYKRLMTIRIVKKVVSAVRMAASPFIGKGLTPIQKTALENAIREALKRGVTGGYLQSFDMNLYQSQVEKVQGTAHLDLVLQPAWELRRILVSVSLKA